MRSWPPSSNPHLQPPSQTIHLAEQVPQMSLLLITTRGRSLHSPQSILRSGNHWEPVAVTLNSEAATSQETQDSHPPPPPKPRAKRQCPRKPRCIRHLGSVCQYEKTFQGMERTHVCLDVTLNIAWLNTGNAWRSKYHQRGAGSGHCEEGARAAADALPEADSCSWAGEQGVGGGGGRRRAWLPAVWKPRRAAADGVGPWVGNGGKERGPWTARGSRVPRLEAW